MARFSAHGSQATLAASPGKSALIIANPGASPKRGRVYSFTLSFGGTPADNAIRTQAARTTASGTSTAFVGLPKDPADIAAVIVAGANHSVEPTFVAAGDIFDSIPNQRTTYRWVAFDLDDAIRLAATASVGLAFRAGHASYTGDFTTVADWDE